MYSEPLEEGVGFRVPSKGKLDGQSSDVVQKSAGGEWSCCLGRGDGVHNAGEQQHRAASEAIEAVQPSWYGE